MQLVDEDTDEEVSVTKHKGKKKTELSVYIENCRDSLKRHIECMDNAKNSKEKVKYQAIINSLLLRLKRR